VTSRRNRISNFLLAIAATTALVALVPLLDLVAPFEVEPFPALSSGSAAAALAREQEPRLPANPADQRAEMIRLLRSIDARLERIAAELAKDEVER
jgi:hypothetical protein